MNSVYFDGVDQIGKLFLDYVFFSFETEPILFTCIDKNQKTYLCLCSEIRYERRWIVVECSILTLRNLIEREIDILSAFFSSSKAIIINMDLQGHEQSHVIATKDIDCLDLPEKGTNLKCDQNRARTYLNDIIMRAVYAKSFALKPSIIEKKFNIQNKNVSLSGKYVCKGLKNDYEFIQPTIGKCGHPLEINRRMSDNLNINDTDYSNYLEAS